MIGKMNWANLLAYEIQPADMELFQSYMTGRLAALIGGSRTKGIVQGGVISTSTGLTVSVAAGVAVMPDGTLVNWPALTTTLATSNPSNPRIDRVEIQYALINNTAVQDINSNPLTLDQLYNVTLNVVQGTPSATPAAPAATSANISLGLVTVTAGATTLVSGNITQIVDAGFVTSALALGNNSGFIRFNTSSSKMQFSTDGVNWQNMGSGGGGANWEPVVGASPIDQLENNEKVWLFSQGNSQSLSLFIRLPTGFVSGAPLGMKLSHYSPGSSNNYKFQAVATLVRSGTDAISSTANQYTSTNGDQSMSSANLLQSVVYDLSSPAGLINGIAPSAGDLVLVTLTRVSPSGTEDSNDVRMIPSATEVTFS